MRSPPALLWPVAGVRWPGSMVSRYAAPMCYNFLRLIHMSHYDKRSRKLIPLHTVFEKVRRIEA